MKVVVLDSGPLGLLTNPNNTRKAAACRQCAADLRAAGHRLVVPEVIDYELRRELVLNAAVAGIAALDAYAAQYGYSALDTRTPRRAAEVWAQARQVGRPTAGNQNIDIDMILVAQAEALADPNTVIATTNLSHLRPFFPAELWWNITP